MTSDANEMEDPTSVVALKRRSLQKDAENGHQLQPALLASDDEDSFFPSPPPSATIPRCIPSWFRYENHPIEATGCSLDSFGRGTVVFASIFLAPALLQLASEAAGCEEVGEECDKRVYGFRPSSLLTNIAIFASFASTTLLPLFGAIVDHSRYRKHVGVYTALALVTVKAVEIMVGPSTWLVVAFLQVVSAALYGTHNTAVYAYTSELSPDDPAAQTKFNTDFNISNYVATLIFMIVVLVPSMALGLNDIQTARYSQTVASSVGFLVFFVAWKYCFSHRPARRQVPPGSTLFSSGFRKLISSAHSIATTEKSAPLKWLILSIMLGESASTALVTISTTYITQVLRLSATDMGVIYLIVLLTGIPGSRLGEWVSLKSRSPIRSAQLCEALFVVSTAGAAYQLNGPEDLYKCYFYAVLWGLGLGWMSPVHSTSFMALVPQGSEAEMMGIFLFSVDFISFLPPLVFTVLNEAGLPMALGVASLCIYFLLAMLLLIPIGEFEDAVRKVRSDRLEEEGGSEVILPVKASEMEMI